MVCGDKPKGELGKEWMEVSGRASRAPWAQGMELMGNPIERPRQQSRLEKRQGLTISVSVLGGVVFNRHDTGTVCS